MLGGMNTGTYWWLQDSHGEQKVLCGAWQGCWGVLGRGMQHEVTVIEQSKHSLLRLVR